MKKLFVVLLIGLLGGVSLFAQSRSVTSGSLVEFNKKDAGFYCNGLKLTEPEIRSRVGESIYYDTYLSAMQQHKYVKPLILYGSIGAGVGLTLTIVGVFCCYPLVYAGAPIFSAGSAAVGTGIAFMCISNGRLSWIGEQMNSRSKGYSLAFGMNPSGVGLSLRF